MKTYWTIYRKDRGPSVTRFCSFAFDSPQGVVAHLRAIGVTPKSLQEAGSLFAHVNDLRNGLRITVYPSFSAAKRAHRATRSLVS